MSELTKKDVKEIVDGSIKEAVKDLPTRKEVVEIVNTVVDKKVGGMIDDAVGELAASVQARFENVDKRFDKVETDISHLKKDNAEIKYLLTDVVRRNEFVELKDRVGKLEKKVG